MFNRTGSRDADPTVHQWNERCGIQTEEISLEKKKWAFIPVLIIILMCVSKNLLEALMLEWKNSSSSRLNLPRFGGENFISPGKFLSVSWKNSRFSDEVLRTFLQWSSWVSSRVLENVPKKVPRNVCVSEEVSRNVSQFLNNFLHFWGCFCSENATLVPSCLIFFQITQNGCRGRNKPVVPG